MSDQYAWKHQLLIASSLLACFAAGSIAVVLFDQFWEPQTGNNLNEIVAPTVIRGDEYASH